ncbi:MAG: dethiobiotin synthase [Polyangiaceae bacterium]|jgi:dethiobiotin synthetase|nr:dethiobiotin synthase [Polyangiaceae bacterium]
MNAPAVFVAGTDTGVGKTRVGVALSEALRSRGLRVGVFKPAETGCSPEAPADALALREASGCQAPLDLICPYRLPEPLAPAIAAKRARVRIDPLRVEECLRQLRVTHDVVVCEGAGGLLVPFCDGVLTVEWLREVGLPVVLVGRLGLGSINHTLLSARLLASVGLELLGTILSETHPASTVAEQTNPHVLRGYPEVALLGVLGHASRPRWEASWVEHLAGRLGLR